MKSTLQKVNLKKTKQNLFDEDHLNLRGKLTVQ